MLRLTEAQAKMLGITKKAPKKRSTAKCQHLDEQQKDAILKHREREIRAMGFTFEVSPNYQSRNL